MRKDREKREIFDLQKHRQMLAKNKTVLIILLSLLFLAFSVAIYFIASSIISPKTKEYVLQLNYNVEDDTDYAYFKDKIVALNAEGLKIYDADGLVSYSRDMRLKTPVLQVGDKLILTYDSGGNSLMITDGNSVRFEKVFDTALLKAKIASNGNLITITSKAGYKAVVSVYNRYFEEIYRWSSAAEYVADADVTENGKMLAVASYSGENALITSSVSYFDLKDDSGSQEKINNLDGLPYLVDFKDGMSLHLVTSDGLYNIDEDFSASPLYAFDATYLRFFTTDKNEITALIVDKNIASDSADLLIFKENSLIKLVDIDSQVRALDSSQKYISVLTDSTAAVYTLDGKLYASTETTNQAKDIIVSNKGEMIVFDLEKVTLVK